MNTLPKIIVDINIYKNNIIISYLGGLVHTVPLISRINKEFLESSNFLKEVNFNSSIVDLTFKHNSLLGIQDDNLKIQSLIGGNDFRTNNEKKIIVAQLAKDSITSSLYGVSNNGFEEYSVSISNKISVVDNFTPSEFGKWSDKTFSNLRVESDSLLLSIRGFGVSSINKNDVRHPLVLPAEDPQDAIFFDKKRYLIVADAFKGILIQDLRLGKEYRKIMLPNSDFPQQVEVLGKNIIFKGKNGIYQFQTGSEKLKIIYENRVGVMNTYGKSIIVFSSKGNIHFYSSKSSKMNYHNIESNLQNIYFSKY